MPAGRPTDYRAEFCERVIELGKEGKSHAQIAAELGVSRRVLYDWQEKYPEFLHSIMEARDYAQAWFENIAQNNLLSPVPGFSASLWAKQVSCRFPDDYTDKTKQEQTVKITSVSWET
jgi:Homeodomain-like domain